MPPPPSSSSAFVSFGQLLARRLMLCGILFLAGLTPMAYWIVQYTFEDLESSYAQEKLHFVDKFLASEDRALKTNSFDYGNWQASYEAVRGKNPNYYVKDLRRDDLINFNVQALGLFEPNGKLKSWAPEVGPTENSLHSMEPVITSLIQEHVKTLVPVSLPGKLGSNTKNPYFAWTKAVWLASAPNPVMVAIAPVLSSDPVQKHGGWMVLMRILDQDYVRSLAEQTDMPFTIERSTPQMQDETVSFIGSFIVGTKTLTEQPSFGVRIQLTPHWEEQRLRMFGTIFMAAFMLLFFLMLFGYVLMETTVLRRLHELTTKVRGIELSDVSEPLPVQKNKTDEIDVLAIAINGMYEHVSKANRQLSHDSRHDALTGLANRRDLMLTLADLKNRLNDGDMNSFGLMLLDLNGFKPINDNIGHAAGDVVLQKLAERFHAIATPDLRFFRVGGDEFAVVVHHADEQSLNATLPSIHDAVKTPIHHDGHLLQVDASIGVALAKRQSPWSADSLLRTADTAMYENKRRRQGKAREPSDKIGP